MRINISKEELEELYVLKRLSSRKIAKIYGCSYSGIDSKIKKFGFTSRTLAEAHVIYPRKNFSGDLIEKAYMIGFRIGDLRVRKFYRNSETIHVDCGSTKIEQINLINDLFKQYGRVWVSKPSTMNKVQIECFLNNSFDFLLQTNPNEIEKWICRSKKYFASFLSGFTDAEGTVFISRNRATFALGNYNIALLQQIKEILLEFGISSPKIVCSVRKGLVATHGYKYNHDYWILSITKKSELLKLFKFMKPYLKHTKRIRNIEIAISNIEMRNQLYGK